MSIAEYISFLKGKNIHIVGVSAVEGAEIALFLDRHGVDCTFHDRNTADSFFDAYNQTHFGYPPHERKARYSQLSQHSINFDADYLSGVEDADIIFVPQSWYLYEENAALHGLRERLFTLMQLYFKLLPCKIIGVTGSNGKTTTTFLINEIMQAYTGGAVYLAGNDRRGGQLLGNIEHINKEDWVVLEISNRHLLTDLGRSPDISVITNVTPNHLTEHPSFEEYALTKESLLAYHDDAGIAVLNFDNDITRAMIASGRYHAIPFSVRIELEEGVCLSGSSFVVHKNGTEVKIARVGDSTLPGEHSRSNLAAAIAATYAAGIAPEDIQAGIKRFNGVPQRLELIREINDIAFYNDSASTTPESTISALKAFDKPITLMLGGRSKDTDYAELLDTIVVHVERVIVFPSPVGNMVKQGLVERGFAHDKIIEIDLLKQAVDYAYEKTAPGSVVLFSPAAEFFPYFKNIMPGCKNFRKFVEKL